MKKLLFLMLLAGCEACAWRLPKMEIPDTRPISEFAMDYEVRMYIGGMFATALRERKEHGACLWGHYELSEVKMKHKSPYYYKLVFDSIAPANTTSATENTLGIGEGGPCLDYRAIATIHTHLSPSGLSAQDLLMFISMNTHVATFVVNGFGMTKDGKPLVQLQYVTRHGLTGIWVIPLFEEEEP